MSLPRVVSLRSCATRATRRAEPFFSVGELSMTRRPARRVRVRVWMRSVRSVRSLVQRCEHMGAEGSLVPPSGSAEGPQQ